MSEREEARDGDGRKRVVLIPGEDAAPEAFEPTVALIDRLQLPIEWVRPLVGLPAKEACGDYFPPEARAAIDASDATLFGSTSGPSFRAIGYLRWGRDTYANVRPVRWMPGCRSPLSNPVGIDMVVVRENIEDVYCGVEGPLEDLAAFGFRSRYSDRPIAEMAPGRYALKVISERGSERIARFAFELARQRRARGRPGKVTSGTKHNVLPQSDGYFLEVTRRVAADYPDIAFEALLADDLAHKMVVRPQSFDVILLPNLYGDLYSDLAGGIVGGLGLAPSGCYGADYAYFESAHGSAPDIAGKNIINPTATILSAAMMLEHLGFGQAAARIERGIEAVYAEGRALTPDQGGSATTTEFCAALAALL